MSDDVDVANKLADEAVARALANRIKNIVAISPIDCAECGEPIEVARRELLAGTEHCAECAQFFAARNRFVNGK